ncbi:uncharacterized protein LOC128983670 [Macrosteles quadrilineatus]|uniref:uncharacterized protein LOC128983670 n=1 Tax=Macrosteles quadrilineatus TaxID=74068 RepID=UPI0023E2F208|nr:uncharacterized protein LOC128983670 [Macrosteles quadrilineatus]
MLSKLVKRAILGQPRLPGFLKAIRNLTVTELETKGKYTLKVNVEPFKEDEVQYTIQEDHITIVGKRGEKTGKSDFFHGMDTKVSLPPTIKHDTIKTKFDQGNVIVEADSSVQ